MPPPPLPGSGARAAVPPPGYDSAAGRLSRGYSIVNLEEGQRAANTIVDSDSVRELWQQRLWAPPRRAPGELGILGGVRRRDTRAARGLMAPVLRQGTARAAEAAWAAEAHEQRMAIVAAQHEKEQYDDLRRQWEAWEANRKAADEAAHAAWERQQQSVAQYWEQRLGKQRGRTHRKLVTQHLSAHAQTRSLSWNVYRAARPTLEEEEERAKSLSPRRPAPPQQLPPTTAPRRVSWSHPTAVSPGPSPRARRISHPHDLGEHAASEIAARLSVGSAREDSEQRADDPSDELHELVRLDRDPGMFLVRDGSLGHNLGSLGESTADLTADLELPSVEELTA